MTNMTRGTCVVVGAGPGLGAALARRFGGEGYRVALVSRGSERLDALAVALGEDGIEAIAVPADAADADDLRRAVEAAGRLPIEVLVYNAAVYPSGRPGDLEPAALAGAFAVNVTGALVAAQAVLPGMAARGRGTILLTGGGAALKPGADWTALSVTKAALRAFAFTLHEEALPHGVHAATVTVMGSIGSTPDLAPAAIAAAFADLHHAPLERWTAEVRHP